MFTLPGPKQPANRGPKGGYRNRAVTRDEANDIAIRVGQLASDRDADGTAKARTTRVELRPSGDGYDLVIPAEHVERLCDLGRGQVVDAILDTGCERGGW